MRINMRAGMCHRDACASLWGHQGEVSIAASEFLHGCGCHFINLSCFVGPLNIWFWEFLVAECFLYTCGCHFINLSCFGGPLNVCFWEFLAAECFLPGTVGGGIRKGRNTTARCSTTAKSNSHKSKEIVQETSNTKTKTQLEPKEQRCLEELMELPKHQIGSSWTSC